MTQMAEEYIVADDTGFKKSLFQFSQNTTFHGVRYIGKSKSIVLRSMWTLCVLACLTAVVIQIVDRIRYFESRPLNVNVQINYNQTLTFPAVTICNQNAFRATEASSHGHYHLIEDMFSKSHVLTVDDLKRHNAIELSLEELYIALAHQKKDMIVDCEWNKVKCSMDDFNVILTDHGVCFKFEKNEADMRVSSAGVEFGLRLTLNVEQYEYMTGPHDSAGIKMLLHDPRELPFVKELGQAIPTGTHAFVGLKFMTIDNMPAPYGDCEDTKLSHTDYYTSDGCYAECLVRLAAAQCGCRDSYMPPVNGEPPVCTVEKYHTCLKGLKDNFSKKLREGCQCTVPCQFTFFDPSLSYATISNHLVDKLLTKSEASNLKNNLLNASEVTARMDNTKFENVQSMVNNLRIRFNDMKNVVDAIAKCLEIQTNTTEFLYADLMDVYTAKKRLYRYQEFVIERSFLRGLEAMEERTLRTLVDAYAEFAMIASRQIRRLAAMSETMTSEREALYELIIDRLKVRQEIVELARGNISVLLDAFITGKAIFNYTFEDIDISHNPFIVPKPLLNYSMHHNKYMEHFVPKLRSDDFDLLYCTLEMFINETMTAFLKSEVNDTQLNYVFERFQFACREFMFSKSVVYGMGIELPMKVLKERHLDFDNIWGEFDLEIYSLNRNIKSLTECISYMYKTIFPDFQDVLLIMDKYIDHANVRLMQMAEFVLSNKTQNIESEMKNVFQEIQTRGQSISDSWSLIAKPVHEIWKKVISDEDMVEYYLYTNNTDFLQNLTDVLKDWNTKINTAKEGDFRSNILHADTDFFLALDEIRNHLNAFKDSIKVDSDFLRQNFLQLDIFYQQLSYEQISQQKAYDFFALICDIGGSMGLFIGASMLTVAELLDFLLLQISLFRRRSNSKKS